jgi:rare lipoprotein A (peptidoglycan hydrolase)
MAKAYHKYALLFLLHFVLLTKARSQELPDTLSIPVIDPLERNDSINNYLQDSNLAVKKAYTQIGRASYYANKFQGRKTASGERYSHHKYTAAHRKFKFGTKVKVTNLKTGVWVIVKVNDRGPYSKKFMIDLSLIAAKKLNLHKTDAKVKMEVLEEAPNKK